VGSLFQVASRVSCIFEPRNIVGDDICKVDFLYTPLFTDAIDLNKISVTHKSTFDDLVNVR